MTCFDHLNRRTGKRLTWQTGLHSCAHFTVTLVRIPTADRSFGANGSRLVHTDNKRCEDTSHSKSIAREIRGEAYLFSSGSGRPFAVRMCPRVTLIIEHAHSFTRRSASLASGVTAPKASGAGAEGR